MEKELNIIDSIEELLNSFNVSISDAMESFKSEYYGILTQALNIGIKIGQNGNSQNNAQCSLHDVNSCLPEEGKRVGVLTKDGAMFFGCVFNGSFPSGVTHWLDIPEIPTKN